MMPDFRQLAKQFPRKIVLPEGKSSRILEAALYCDQQQIAEITLLGDPDVIQQQIEDRFHSDIGTIQVIKPPADDSPNFIINYANELVMNGDFDACVAGVKHTTGDIIRAALRVIGTKIPKTRPSSFFIIESPQFTTPVIFADCAMNISPTAKQLAEIAFQSSQSITTLLDFKPKIALLSFSTNGSAQHQSVTKVREAVSLLHQHHPELEVVGDIQFDAAISADILDKKWPDSGFTPPANIFIFPSLDAANLAYKIAEHMGGAKTTGPILQGLNKPMNDLSRGATVESIINTIAVTALQVSH